MSAPKHPAPFADVFLDFVRGHMNEHAPRALALLDPMAGTCKLHVLQGHHETELRHDGYDVYTVCSELEPEWAQRSPTEWGETHTGLHAFHALSAGPMRPLGYQRWIVTSPVWGNRMADHHDAKDDSERLTYRHRLGRPLSQGSSCSLAWGEDYQAWHRAFLDRAFESSFAGERMIIEIGDHLRTLNGRTLRAQVTAWWIKAGIAAGWHLDEAKRLPVGRLRNGANYDVRIPYIHALVFVR